MCRVELVAVCMQAVVNNGEHYDSCGVGLRSHSRYFASVFCSVLNSRVNTPRPRWMKPSTVALNSKPILDQMLSFDTFNLLPDAVVEEEPEDGSQAAVQDVTSPTHCQTKKNVL